MSTRRKLQTYVDLKYFDSQVFINEELTAEKHSDIRVYKIIHKNRKYILKGCTIALDFERKTSREKSLSFLSDVYQEYFLMKAISNLNPNFKYDESHFAKPLAIDYKIISRCNGFVHIEMLFDLSLIHICRCRRYAVCRSRWSPYH
eukprot:TRINITY_DN2029_c0_g1_i15.p2 TRINITY_DN2029_c0_g1~~TRINITY_DN2029_c0_g1_i15.p2  ORF type:complete len:146 (+),score=20.07 TRINITY_DN2029_c0_g1_i15:147-584(+)